MNNKITQLGLVYIQLNENFIIMTFQLLILDFIEFTKLVMELIKLYRVVKN